MCIAIRRGSDADLCPGRRHGLEGMCARALTSDDGVKLIFAQILRDPSRRQGYTKEIEIGIDLEKWTIQGTEYKDGGDDDTERWVNACVNHAISAFRIFNDGGNIAFRELHVPFEKCFRNFLGRNPQIIGASGFWHNTRSAGDDGYKFDFVQHLTELKAMRNQPHNQSHNSYYVNNFFAGIWMREVLKHGFDINPESVVFTPYNGHNGRLNWTLGAAVLYASPNLTNLGDGMDVCCKTVP
jgi:hypothetical protein